VSPVKYELGSYIPEDDILHSDRRENLKSYSLSQEDYTFKVCSRYIRTMKYRRMKRTEREADMSPKGTHV
jgi:hypothetical protein